ncbi:MAG TPA: hypothetical protein DEG09_10315 [Marinilabiliaceae bacterium]|nr:hypothetical protein [Marinilabiliaceae bacterium]HBX88989.1 hypothetical protein [Marinilabiliaceae bacterium]
MMFKKRKKYEEFESGNEALQDIKGYTFKEFINGQFFSSSSLVKQWPYFVFVVILAFIYINNHYAVEKLLKEQVGLNRELQELKYEAITTSSELMQMSRQSEVVSKVNDAGLELEVLKSPPRLLRVEK